MPTNGSWARNGPVAAVTFLLAAATAAQAPPNLDDLLARIAERVEEYFKRVQSIVCVEKVMTQPISTDMSVAGFARELEYEVRVESEPAADGVAAEAKVTRDLRKVNGRAPRPKDKPNCIDPNPISPDPLSFLLQSHRGEYTFTWAGFGKGKDQHLLMLDFRLLKADKPELIDNVNGDPDCYRVTFPGLVKGRVWIDARTHDVLRVEEHLVTRVDYRVSFPLQRRHNLPDSVVVHRYDVVRRYKPVAFDNPQETILLPDSIDTIALLHGLGSLRIRQVFSDYKRFVTGARILK